MHRTLFLAAAAALSLALAVPVGAKIVAESVEYSVGEQVFEGLVVRNAALENPRGTVLIVHDWNGIDAYEQRRAEMLAAEGYTAFAVDLFGRDAVLEGIDDYRRETGALYGDRTEFRARLSAAIEAASDIPGATGGMVLMGYCFGGAAVLEAARMGADLSGFVSFHGGLETPEGQDWSEANGTPVLVLHGSADPVSGMGALAELMDELREAGLPHAAEIYGGARHSFTVWGSNDYELTADTRSWAALLRFLSDAL